MTNIAFDRWLVEQANVKLKKLYKRLKVPHESYRFFPLELLWSVVKIRRILSNPLIWMNRRNAARKIIKSSPHANFIDRNLGYRCFKPDELPGIMEAVNAADRLLRDRYCESHFSNSKKTFYSNILERKDLKSYPELLDFALSVPIIDATSAYLGSLARLYRLGVFISPSNNTLKSSQLFHLDGEDFQQVKCFINIHDVNSENGPFTFIPADESLKIRRSIGYHRDRNSLSDESVLEQTKKSRIVSLLGKAGTGALVDTSRCLHYGSRCRAGYRAVIMLQYLRVPNVSVRHVTDFDQPGTALEVKIDRSIHSLSA